MTASITERLAGLHRQGSCQVCVFLATLDARDRAEVEHELDLPRDERVGARALAAALAGLPEAPGRNPIERHRNGHV